MYPGAHATARAREPVQIMGGSGEILTYAEYEARANRLAHFFRAFGLKRLDHYAVFMENNPRFIECGAAGERSGLYYTNVNSYLTPGELAYILDNSESQVLITSQSRSRSRAGCDEERAGRAPVSDRRWSRRRRAGQKSRRGDGAISLDADP